MNIGLSLPQIGAGVSASAIRDFAQSADALGFSTLWGMERIFRARERTSRYGGPNNKWQADDHDIPAAWGTVITPTEMLAYVAAYTENVRLGTRVLITGYYQPVDLAKRAVTLDVLSNGRFDLGLGVGWSAEEHTALGTDFATRGARTDEFIEVLRACWGPDPVEYEGRFFKVPAADIGPKPVQRGGIPLLSGMWSDRGLARTVQHFDGWVSGGGKTAEEAAAVVADMQAQRPDRPMRSYYVVFVQPPTCERPPYAVNEIAREVEAAARYDFHEIVIDLNVYSVERSERDWADLPAMLAPALLGGIRA